MLHGNTISTEPFHLTDAVQIQTLSMLFCKQVPGIFHYSTKYYYAILMQRILMHAGNM